MPMRCAYRVDGPNVIRLTECLEVGLFAFELIGQFCDNVVDAGEVLLYGGQHLFDRPLDQHPADEPEAPAIGVERSDGLNDERVLSTLRVQLTDLRRNLLQLSSYNTTSRRADEQTSERPNGWASATATQGSMALRSASCQRARGREGDRQTDRPVL
jgi:hypothetical protein